MSTAFDLEVSEESFVEKSANVSSRASVISLVDVTYAASRFCSASGLN